MALTLVSTLFVAACNDTPTTVKAEEKPSPCPTESVQVQELQLQLSQQITIVTQLQTIIMEKNKTINNLLHAAPDVEGSPRRSK